MKVTNPFSRKKKYYSNRFTNIFFKALSFLCLKFSKDEYKKKWVKQIKDDKIEQSMEIALTKPNALNKLDFNNLIMGDIVFLEDFEKLKNGLIKLFRDNKQVPFSRYFRVEQMEKFFNSLSTNRKGTHISRLFNIEVLDKDVSKLCKNIEFDLIAETYSFITIRLNVIFTDELKRTILEKMFKDTDSRFTRMKKPDYIKDYMKILKWTRETRNKEIHKMSVIEDLFMELKWQISKFVNRYIPLFFFEHKKVCPSLEFFISEQNYCPNFFYSDKKIREESKKYEAMGLHGRLLHDISTDGRIELHYGCYSGELFDESVRVVVNGSNYDQQKETFSFWEYVALTSDEISSKILVDLCLLNVIDHFDDRMMNYRKKYDSIQAKNMFLIRKYKKLSELKVLVDKDLMYIKRLEIQNFSDLGRKHDLKEYSSNFIGIKDEDLLTHFNSTFEWRIKRSFPFNKGLSNDINSQINITDTIINYKMQRKMLWMTLASLLVAILALYISLKMK